MTRISIIVTLQGIRAMTEPGTGRTGIDFEVVYEVVVWKADVPAAYEHVLVGEFR